MLNNLSFLINYSKLIISYLAEPDKSSLLFIFDITFDLSAGERPSFFKNLTFLFSQNFNLFGTNLEFREEIN